MILDLVTNQKGIGRLYKKAHDNGVGVVVMKTLMGVLLLALVKTGMNLAGLELFERWRRWGGRVALAGFVLLLPGAYGLGQHPPGGPGGRHHFRVHRREGWNVSENRLDIHYLEKRLGLT